MASIITNPNPFVTSSELTDAFVMRFKIHACPFCQAGIANADAC